MAIQIQPLIGQWYQSVTGDCFEVVAYDTDAQTVGIQHYDGAVEELDIETWLELSLAPMEAPEDWLGALDVSREDIEADPAARPHYGGYNFLNDVDGLG
jgi:hypothetical protein